jgi:hypothetical protein
VELLYRILDISSLLLLQEILKLFHVHQDLAGLGPFLRAHDAGVAQLVHDAGRAVKADLEQPLQAPDGCFFFLNDKDTGINEVFIAIIFRFLSADRYASCPANRGRSLRDFLTDLFVVF